MITGPSGVGKGTLIRSLLHRLPALRLAVSATTRSPRAGEENGREYHFLSRARFEERLEAGDFLEHADYAGNRYGTLTSEVSDLPAGTGVVLEIEVQGARQVRERLPEALQVFIAPPSIAALRERLVSRGADTPEAIDERLALAGTELDARSRFEHVVVNDRLEVAVDELVELVGTIIEQQPRGAGK